MIVPRPVRFESLPGRFVLTPETPVRADAAVAGAPAVLRELLGPSTGCWFPAGAGVAHGTAGAGVAHGTAGADVAHGTAGADVAHGTAGADVAHGTAPGTGGVHFAIAEEMADEEYRLEVSADAVQVTAGGPPGAIYGIQSLRQLLPPAAFRRAGGTGAVGWEVPCVVVEDRPRYGWRGCMLDVARHFLPKADVLRFIDLLAMHKLNVLHLHLTDDQGWRLEIKRYPRLTEVGAWRSESMTGFNTALDGRPHGGFYTQDDIREIVAYAAARQITVVPEIDIPGHSEAAIAAYPSLGNRDEPLTVGTLWGISPNVLNVSDETIGFFENVFDEVFDLFPSEIVHVGGDECPKDQWKASPSAQQRMRDQGLKDEDELQSWFIRQFAEHFAANGRRLLGWDEILEGGLPPGAIVASWRGLKGAVTAARAGHDVITCPVHSLYFDYRQSADPGEPIPVGSVITVADVHAYEPAPAGLSGTEASRVLGSQANVWTEAIDSVRGLDYQVFPRLCAFAEAVWSPQDRDFDEFSGRLAGHLERLDAIGVEYRRSSGPLPWQTRPNVRGRER